MNLLHIMGYLGADPEMRYTPSGQKVTTLRVGTKTRKGGQEETIWWRITVWGDQFDKMLTYFKKGKPIYIVAEMNKLDIYQDKSGQPQISYEATARSLHFPPFSDRSENEQQGPGPQQSAGRYGASSHGQEAPAYQAKQGQGRSEEFEVHDEDPIPF